MLQTVAIFQSIVSFCVLNVRSARNKVGDIYDEFSEKKLDFMVPYNRGSKTRVLQVNVSYTEAKPQWKDSVS